VTEIIRQKKTRKSFFPSNFRTKVRVHPKPYDSLIMFGLFSSALMNLKETAYAVLWTGHTGVGGRESGVCYWPSLTRADVRANSAKLPTTGRVMAMDLFRRTGPALSIDL
jgi:hypothetical protein